MRWRIEYLNSRVKADLDAQPREIRSRFERIVSLISEHGLEQVHEPYVKHLQGPLWEMRMKGKDTIARAVYVTVRERRVVILHVFTKKTQKTPRKEIDIALRRLKDIG